MTSTTFVNQSTPIVADWLNDVDAAVYEAASAISGSVARTAVAKFADRVSIKDFGTVVSDGTTDQTTAITTILSTLSSNGFRGWVHIPYNTKFTVSTVYAAVPTGVILDDESSVNWGQPPTYKNKFRVMYSGDTVSDDTQYVVASGHHPAIMLLNMGTAGTTGASDRYASLLHGVGKDADGDPILGWLFQFAEEAGNSVWRTSLRLQTPYVVAVANPQPWVTATVYSAGAYCTSDSGKVYKTTAGGTSGVTAPTGTGTGISDGGVTWDYVQAALNIDSTRFDWNENGHSGQYAPTGGAARHTMQAGTRSMYLELDDATDEITFRDVSRGLDVFDVSDSHGFRPGMGLGQNWIAVTGTGPNAPTTGYGKVSNGGATNMSTLVPPASRVTMMVTLRFDDANTTVVHGTGTNNIRLKSAANTNPAAGSYLTLAWDSSDTSSWREVSRSY